MLTELDHEWPEGRLPVRRREFKPERSTFDELATLAGLFVLFTLAVTLLAWGAL